MEVKVWADWYCIRNKMKALCQGLERPEDPFDGIPLVFKGIKEEYIDGLRARTTTLRPQGPVSVRPLAYNLTVLVVGDSVFVHGGIFPDHVSYGFEWINNEVSAWINGLNGKLTQAPDYCHSSKNGVVCWRDFSRQLANECDCSTLKHVLSTIPGVKSMIMGHTIQELGINGVCNNLANRLDVVMSKGCIRDHRKFSVEDIDFEISFRCPSEGSQRLAAGCRRAWTKINACECLIKVIE